MKPLSAPNPNHILAESSQFLVYHLCETAYLHFKNGSRADVAIGHFYGDPETGFMAPDESYCVVAGCGLIIYYLSEPFNEYQYDLQNANWEELGREPGDIYWIECVYSPEPTTEIRFVVDPHDEDKRGVYQLKFGSFEVMKLI